MGFSHSISLSFRQDEYSFLLEMAEKTLNNNGEGISKTAILRSLIRFLQCLDMELSGVKTEEQLTRQLQKSLENC